MVSPTNTGPVNLILSHPRLAIAFWLMSDTLIPVTMDSVSAELTSGFFHSLVAA